MTITVELSPNEVHLAATHAVMRRVGGRISGRPEVEHTDTAKWDRWSREIEGACAELALCKWRDVYWAGLAHICAVDAGTLEVRWTKHEGNGRLLIRERDADNTIFVLVDGFAPLYRFVGWLHARDGKREEWREKWGFLVPREHLHTDFGALFPP